MDFWKTAKGTNSKKWQTRADYRLNDFSSRFNDTVMKDLMKSLIETIIDELRVTRAGVTSKGFYNNDTHELRKPQVFTELQIKFDLFVEELFYLENKEGAPPVLNRDEWFYFKIPVDRNNCKK